MKKILILTLASLLSFGLFANDQKSQLDSVAKFVGKYPLMLLEGKDEVGECRVMIYSATTPDISNFWFEGTFQNPQGNGPVAGVAVSLLVSSDADVAKIEEFKIDDKSLFVKMIYPGEISYSMTLEKSLDESFSAISYTAGQVTRKCENLKRIL